MGIVLNEHYSAEESIENKSLGRKPSETLCRVARYYMDELPESENNKDNIRKKMESFLLQCDSTISIPKWDKILTYAIERAGSHEAINIKYIPITDKEIDIINNLKGKQIKRLAFVLICLAKYWNFVNPLNDNWVNNKDNEIMSFANINTSVKRQCEMYAKLREEGLISFSKKVDNTNVKVCFISPGKDVIHITDLRNLGYQYLKYCGEPFFECANCGITTKIDEPNKGRKQKYCKSCAIEIKTKQNVNSVMKGRDRKI